MITVNIPAERVKVLLGERGEAKKFIEERGKVKLLVDADGLVEVRGAAVDEWIAKDVVAAIGRGFNPHKAFRLFSDEYTLRVINLRDFCSSENEIKRVAGRAIGEQGKTRRIIEEISECDMSVYAHTISLIGRLDSMHLASDAVFKLIEGAPHAIVYAFLEKGRRKMKEGRLLELKYSKRGSKD